jgi:hypothetical protein
MLFDTQIKGRMGSPSVAGSTSRWSAGSRTRDCRPGAEGGGPGKEKKRITVDALSLQARVPAFKTWNCSPRLRARNDYDPLARGYIKSLSRPTGTVTGLSLQQIELARKRLQLLMDALPSTRAATMFWDSFSEDQWNPSDDRDVLIIAVSPAFYRDRQRLSEFALRKKIASMFGLREWVQAGSLLCYGVSFTAIFRRAADYVDRIAKGVKAADLPKKAHANAPGD